ncbi:hypothetical protein BDM02DRAFT_3106441 [Thelephora ganbajun]|uniref:Uncharacterized protein n=1 Tax=Thelephora ganbajun TaxID=370292 RepID=A0ACB6ZXM6_THEGA|nr:hypothetical protein BDM02DRAFT_3106441 [Thelephora ganbajun]
MSFKALVYAYVIGGFTFIPLALACAIFYTVYTSVPVPSPSDPTPQGTGETEEKDPAATLPSPSLRTTDLPLPPDVRELPKVRKGWLTVRRTFEESNSDGSYVTLVRSFLDSRSKDPKRSRPKDMWYVTLKGKVLYLYEDEGMTEVEAAIELGGHDVVIYPEGLLDGELFAKRNAICLKPKPDAKGRRTPKLTKRASSGSGSSEDGDRRSPSEKPDKAEERKEVITPPTPWFIFVSNIVEMEDWYLGLIHASDNPPNQPPLSPLAPVFDPIDMLHLVETLDEQPDVIPMRWFNALIGRVFFSFYRTHILEDYIIGRLMRKLSKVKRPAFLTDVVVTEVSVGNTAPTFSKPMLKELTKEGDASLEVRVHYKGEVRITVQAVVTINLGARFKSYSVKLVLAVVLRELDGNLLVKVKRPPSARIWYAFTQMPKMVLDVEPVVSDRQITWNMILSQIESRLKEVIMESVVMPNMDDISYFGSSDYSHRGGIWVDAARPERQPATMDGSSDPNPHQTQIQAETTPELLSTTLVSPPPPTRDPNIPTFVTEDNRDQEEHPSDDSSEASSPPRSTAAAVSQSRSTSSSTTNRRSWFMPTRDEDSNAESEPSLLHVDDPSSRGRPEAITYDLSSSSRSASTHSDTFLEANSTPSEPSPSPKTPPPLPPRRELPQQRPEMGETVPAPSKSPQSLLGRVGTNASTNPNGPTTGSFFSTLKARAADKEALKDSAKEAMKKWSANWASLKKGGSDEPASGMDDGQFKGYSYAEIRRHVEERHKTTSTPGHPTGTNEIPSSSTTDRTSPSPRTQRRSSRRLSVSGGLPTGQSISSSDPVSHSASQDTPADRDDIFRDRGPETDVTPPAPAPHPIYTQPSAPKMMMIPGIHASHRGEVQSMGYVAPTPESAEPKLKAPAIQNVYRLWKNPGSGQTMSTTSKELMESSHLEGGEIGSSPSQPSQSNPPILTPLPPPSSTTLLSPNLKRMVPPPLPARTTVLRLPETSVTKASPDPAEFGNVSASAALKSIASLDNNSRGHSSSSFEHLDNNLQPPPVAVTGNS